MDAMVENELDLLNEIERLLVVEDGKTWREKKRKSRRVTVVAVDRAKGLVCMKGFKMAWWLPILEFFEKYERVYKG